MGDEQGSGTGLYCKNVKTVSRHHSADNQAHLTTRSTFNFKSPVNAITS